MRDEEMQMTDPPTGPDPNVAAGDDIDVRPDREAARGISRWQKAVGILGLVAVVWVGNEWSWLGLGGSGDGDHRPVSGEPPTPDAGSTSREAPVGDQQHENAPNGGAGHDPGQWDH